MVLSGKDMSTFVKYLETLDTVRLRAVRHIIAKELFQKIDLGNKPYLTEKEEQEIQKEVDEKNKKIGLIDQELRKRVKMSKSSKKT
jgi:hypothetical protein